MLAARGRRAIGHGRGGSPSLVKERRCHFAEREGGRNAAEGRGPLQGVDTGGRERSWGRVGAKEVGQAVEGPPALRLRPHLCCSRR